MHSQRIKGICIADPNANCVNCALNEKLLCNFSMSFAHKFGWMNLSYRIMATAVAVFTAMLTSQWWLVYTYVAAVLLTFLLIEPRLLCSHCPFYAREGKTLDCWALRGMPKFWRYRPEPISPLERGLMLAVGGFIDLFSFLVAIFGIGFALWHSIAHSPALVVLILLAISINGLTILGYYSNKMLQGDACKRCPNFSCAMNKTPDDVKSAFLEKNPTMAKAWQQKLD